MESNPSLDDSRQIWSCVACRRRKVKCDRRAPGCEVCARMGLECHYPVAGRLPSRGRAPPQWSSSHQKQTDLLARLRRLEAVVTELSAQVDEVNEPPVQEEQTRLTSSETAASSTEIGEEPSEDFGTLVTGQDGRVRIARSFWSVFCDEVDHIFQSIQDASEVAEEGGQNAKSSLSTHMFGLGGDVALLHHNDMDMSTTQLSFLLQSFKERVDPFVKVLATDTLKHLCNSWSMPSSELGHAQAALRSCALFGAVVALAPVEVQAAFEQPKQSLLLEMRTSAEAHLAQANYLSTSDLTVLQALVIYTSMLPYAGMQDVARPISASTVQISMQNGLHVEAERHRCGDVDVRQMLWLQVCFLSSRVQVADAAVSEAPPSAADTIACSERMYTESHEQRFLLFIRHTIWNLSRLIRRLGRNADPGAVKPLTRAARSAVENQHQRQLHTKSAFVEFVHQMSVLFFAKVEHAFQARKQPMEESERFPHSQALADASITILEAMHSLASRPEWSPWRWQLQGLFPWTAMKLVFARFAGAGGRWTPGEERAWVLAKAVAGAATEEVQRDPAWTALEKLMMAAEERRQRAMQRLMADAMAGGDYMRVIEAGQQVFYGEDSWESSGDGREPGGALNKDENAEKPGSGSFGSREVSSLTSSWPEERSYFYDDLFY